MQTTDQQNEAEKVLEPGLVNTIKRWSNLVELVHDTAMMRYYQKSFFKEKENPKLKDEYLMNAKQYERKVDKLIEQLWPSGKNKVEQQNLF